MGSRCVCSRLAAAPWIPFALKILILLSLVSNAMSKSTFESSCQVEQCTNEYEQSMEQEQLNRGPNVRYCAVLRTYMECLRSKARSCRGHLKYHTHNSLIMQWTNEFNCSKMVKLTNHSQPRPSAQPSLAVSGSSISRGECAYHGKHDFRTCGLFGDPHLRTFGDETQTCRVLGAWPLIDNAYLAVQVTNEAVAKGSKASATTKVTIIIKGNLPCAQEKTYEAQTDNLPSAFIDGTVSSGPDKTVKIREREQGRHVEISIKYIATTIFIRQVGKYLTFAVRMPRDVVHQGVVSGVRRGVKDTFTTDEDGGLQLCVKGCPLRERIDHRQVGGLDPTKPAPVIPQHQAVAKCKEYNVTDFYFDSCVFDLLTTGDTSFSQAASMAQQDGVSLGPHTNGHHNRTVNNNNNTPPSVSSSRDGGSEDSWSISASSSSSTSLLYMVPSRTLRSFSLESVRWTTIVAVVLLLVLLTNR